MYLTVISWNWRWKIFWYHSRKCYVFGYWLHMANSFVTLVFERRAKCWFYCLLHLPFTVCVRAEWVSKLFRHIASLVPGTQKALNICFSVRLNWLSWNWSIRSNWRDWFDLKKIIIRASSHHLHPLPPLWGWYCSVLSHVLPLVVGNTMHCCP